MTIARRRFLATSALAGFGVAALALMPGRTYAIRLEEGDALRQSLLQEACETRTAHEKIVRELIAELSGQEGGGTEGEAKARAIVARMACPFCGCQLVAAD